MKNSLTLLQGITAALLVLLAAPSVAQVKDHENIKYPPLPEREIPRPEVHRLANGLQLFLIEDHELPLISVSGRIRTGSNYEPADKAGLAELVGQGDARGRHHDDGRRRDGRLSRESSGVRRDRDGRGFRKRIDELPEGGLRRRARRLRGRAAQPGFRRGQARAGEAADQDGDRST